MLKTIKIILLTLLLLSPAYAERATCNEDDGNVWASFKPPFVPVTIAVNSGGEIEISTSTEVLTPVGTFGLGYSKNFTSNDNYCYHIIINNISTKEKTIYAIHKGEELNYRSIEGSGIKNLKSNVNRVEFDITEDDVFEISITQNTIYVEEIKLGIEDNILKMKKGEKEIVLQDLSMENYVKDKVVDAINPFSRIQDYKEMAEKAIELIDFFSED